MKKFLRILAVCCIILSGILIIFILVEHFRGELALRSKLKDLAVRGEKLDFHELLPPKLATNQNAALDLIALTNSLRDLSKLLAEAPPMMKLASPGFAISYWQRNEWPNGDKTNSWDEFGPKITAAEPVLSQLQSIWLKPGYDEGFDYSNGLVDFRPLPLIVASRQSAILLDEAVANDLSLGKSEAAKLHLCSLLAEVRDLTDQPLIISQLVRIVCASCAFTATWEFLQSSNLTDAQLDDVQKAWEINNFSAAMMKSFEMEQALTFDYFCQIRSSRSLELDHVAREEQLTESFAAVFGYSGLPTHGFVLRNLHLPLWHLAWAAQDELRALNRWEPILAGGRVAESKSWLEARNFFPQFDAYANSYLPSPTTKPVKQIWYNRCRYLFSEEAFSINGAVILKVLKSETQKNMAITAIALRRFQLKHGKPAQDLSALLPEFMTTIPLDRMDGKPLRYKLNSDGTFKLYSVGVNGTDEGGDPAPEKPSDTITDIWRGKDAVWPMPVQDSK